MPNPYHYSNRHNPCEFCRIRRRKCDYAVPVCGRCLQLGKNCVYTEDARPDHHRPKEQVQSPSAQVSQDCEPPGMLMEAYRRLAALEEVVAMRKAGALNAIMRLERSSSPSESDTLGDDSISVTDQTARSDSLSLSDELSERDGNSPPTNSVARSSHRSSRDALITLVDIFGWEVTFAQTGFRIHTTIHTAQDLLDFATTSLHIIFSNQPMLSLGRMNNSFRISKSRLGARFGEQFTRTYYTWNSSSSNTLSLSNLGSGQFNYILAIIYDIIRTLPTKTSMLLPIIHPSTIPLIDSSHDPMSSPTICALAAFMKPYNMHVLGEDLHPNLFTLCPKLFQRAIDLLDDSMFDDPSFNSFVAITLCAFYGLSFGLVNKAWSYRDLAFRMASILIQTRYKGISRSSFKDQQVHRGVTVTEWETFKRVYWSNVIVESILMQYRIQASAVPEHDLLDMMPELPIPIDDEDDTLRGIILNVTSFIECIKILKPLRLEHVYLSDIEDSTKALCAWYAALPAKYRLPTYEDLTPAKIDDIRTNYRLDHTAVALSLQYHNVMLLIHEYQLNPQSSPVHLPSEICTRCATVVIALNENISSQGETYILMSALYKACDVQYRNTKSENLVIKKTAMRDLVRVRHLSKNLRSEKYHYFRPPVMSSIDEIYEELGISANGP